MPENQQQTGAAQNGADQQQQNNEQAVNTGAQQTQQPASQPLSEHGMMIMETINMARSNPEFAKKPEIAKMLADFDEFQKNGGKVPAQQEGAAQGEQGEKGTDEAGEQNSQQDDTNSESTFFTKPKTVEVKDLTSLTGIIKDKFGITEVSKFIPSAEKWRADSQELKPALDKIEMFENIFAEMPEPLYNAINIWTKGGDYTEATIDAPRINFSKPFENQKEKVTRHYFGNKLAPTADFENPDETLKTFIDLASEKYNLDKTQVDLRRASIQSRADAQAEAFKKSALSSVDNLTQTFPDFNPTQIGKIRQLLVSDNITSLFYNKDGTLKPDAAEKLAFVLYGKEEITRKVKQGKTEARNEKVMESIEKNGRATPTNTGANGTIVLPKNLEALYDGLKQKPVY